MGERVGDADVSDGRVSRRRAPPEIISRGDNRQKLSAALVKPAPIRVLSQQLEPFTK